MGSTALAGDSPTCSIDAPAAAMTDHAAGGQDSNADAGLVNLQPDAEKGVASLQASSCSSTDVQPLSSNERQRLELLESVVQVMGGLYVRE
jgi:hypothetical protein